jgi:hypothetical protein
MRQVERGSRLINSKRLTPAERREARRDYTRNYRSRQAVYGIPTRGDLGEAVLQELILASFRNGQYDKDAPAFKLLSKALRRLAKVQNMPGKPAYSEAGIKHRVGMVLAELHRLPRPEFVPPA